MWRMENKTINKQFCCGMSINLASVFIICFVGFFNNTFNIRTPCRRNVSKCCFQTGELMGNENSSGGVSVTYFYTQGVIRMAAPVMYSKAI